MSENGNENGTVNNMENETEVQDAIVKLITKVVEKQWADFIASGFDLEAHVKNAIDKTESSGIDLEDTDFMEELSAALLLEGRIESFIDGMDFSDIIDNCICWSNAADNVSDYIDWDDKIRYNIDYSDVASEVRDYLDLGDEIAEAIVNFVENGCSQVDDVAVNLYDRAMVQKGAANDDVVILSRDEYNRIMEVVDFIRPVVDEPVTKTGRDMADELVAHVSDPQEAMNIVQTAIVAKATADAQALVASANGGSNDGESSE